MKRFVDTPIVRSRLQVFPNGPMRPQVVSSDSPAPEFLFVAAFLIMLQGFDGILTVIGVKIFGMEMEGNALIRGLMYSVGSIEAVTLAKLTAVVAIALLVYYGQKVAWAKHALTLTCLVYLSLAIFPWLYTLSATMV